MSDDIKLVPKYWDGELQGFSVWIRDDVDMEFDKVGFAFIDQGGARVEDEKQSRVLKRGCLDVIEAIQWIADRRSYWSYNRAEVTSAKALTKTGFCNFVHTVISTLHTKWS